MKWKLFLGIIISAVFLFFAFRSVDPHEISFALKTARYTYVIPAVSLGLLSLCFRALRWKYLMDPIKKTGFRNLFSATSIGFMANNVLPARMGEFIRAYVIGQKEGVSKSSAFATVVVARIFDGLTVLLLFVAILLRYSYTYPGWLRKIVYLAFLLYFAAIGFVILLRLSSDTAFRIADFFLKPFPQKLSDAVNRLLRSFIDGLEVIHSARNIIIAAFFSLLVWIPNALMIYILAHSLSIALPISGAVLLLVIIALGITIPSAPAFIGTIQYVSVAGLALFGVSKASALSFSILFHLVSFLPVTIVGFLFLFADGYSLMELQRSADRNRPDPAGPGKP